MRGHLRVFVSAADRERLAAIVADRNRPQKHVWRARVVLLTAERCHPGRQGDPRDPRQLRRPQTPQRAQVAGTPSPLDLSLHPDLVLLAERGRGLLRQTQSPPAQTRRVPLRRRPPASDQPLHRAPQSGAPTVHLERRPQSHHRRRQTWASNVTDNPLAPPAAPSAEASRTGDTPWPESCFRAF